MRWYRLEMYVSGVDEEPPLDARKLLAWLRDARYYVNGLTLDSGADALVMFNRGEEVNVIESKKTPNETTMHLRNDIVVDQEGTAHLFCSCGWMTSHRRLMYPEVVRQLDEDDELRAELIDRWIAHMRGLQNESTPHG